MNTEDAFLSMAMKNNDFPRRYSSDLPEISAVGCITQDLEEFMMQSGVSFPAEKQMSSPQQV